MKFLSYEGNAQNDHFGVPPPSGGGTPPFPRGGGGTPPLPRVIGGGTPLSRGIPMESPRKGGISRVIKSISAKMGFFQ